MLNRYLTKLAQKEGKSQRWISYRLTFGRFLNFAPMGANSESLPNDLTERRFRSFWRRNLRGSAVVLCAPRRLGNAAKTIGRALGDAAIGMPRHACRRVTRAAGPKGPYDGAP